MAIVIYHNPKCRASRIALETIRAAGIEPEIVEYLKTPYTRTKLVELLGAMGLAPRALIRRKGETYEALDPDNPKLSDDEVIDLMIANPVLIHRPIVMTPKGVKLCRPGESVAEIL